MRKLSKEERARLLRLLRTRERSARRTRAGNKTSHDDGFVKTTARVVDSYADRCRVTRSKRKRELFLSLPPVFSFIDAPKETLEAVNTFVSHLLARPQVIVVDHSQCVSSDHCAESVLSALAMDARKASGIRFRGILPKDPLQRARIMMTGLPDALGLTVDKRPEFYPFRLRMGRKHKELARRSSEREIVTTELTEYINSCVLRFGKRLSDDATEGVSRMIGEVIGNAEDHSLEREWWATAYLHGEPGERIGDCHIALFCFGQTIHQSLQHLPPSSLLRRQIQRLVEQHSSRGFFEKDKWTEENLWTLYALQEGVSRFNKGVGELNTDRGQGMGDLIEFFQNIGQRSDGADRPRMAILSGKTHILFDGTYQLQMMPRPSGRPRRIIAFNGTNDLADRPSVEFVRQVSAPFPGTLISLRFYFDAEHLEARGGQDVTSS